ncbi:MAG: L-rhamnose mutarotase [Candidatus Aminicenantes bacterium RBG_16_63_16]|nr:MAG: L-rhamnose mutarotase [Candidatus Aminicenantes bacterium RBG_16_63_16]
MIRRAVLFQARPGLAAEYERRHNPIWPELEKALKEHGARNYSIYLHAATGQLFGYVEIDDAERFEKIGETEVCRRWWRYMAEVLVCESADSPKGKEEPLRELFHLD